MACSGIKVLKATGVQGYLLREARNGLSVWSVGASVLRIGGGGTPVSAQNLFLIVHSLNVPRTTFGRLGRPYGMSGNLYNFYSKLSLRYVII